MWDFFHKDLFFYLNVAKDLKRSLPSGLGLSETQITSHGFDNTKEGVIEAGAYQGKSLYVYQGAGDGGRETCIECYLFVRHRS